MPSNSATAETKENEMNASINQIGLNIEEDILSIFKGSNWLTYKSVIVKDNHILVTVCKETTDLVLRMESFYTGEKLKMGDPVVITLEWIAPELKSKGVKFRKITAKCPQAAQHKIAEYFIKNMNVITG